LPLATWHLKKGNRCKSPILTVCRKRRGIEDAC
jgi:hypothetical protein